MTPSDQHRSEPIDCLRGLAALWVVEYHVTPLEIFSKGYYGVLLFFVISGYCIAFSANGSDSAWHFYAKRMGRLFPALFVCSLTTILLKKAVPEFVPSGREVSWFDWAYTPLSYVTVGILNISYRPVDGAYWSLQVEFTFYFLYAAVLLFGFKRYAVQVFSWFLLIFAITSAPQTESFYDFFPYFLAGMSVASLVSGDKAVGYLGLGSAFLADLIFLRKHFHQPSIGISALRSLVLWGSTLAIWFAATYRPTATMAKFLRPLAFVGLVSYPLYLLHQDIMLVLYKAFGFELRINAYPTVAAGLLVLTPLFIAMATAVYSFVEVPLIAPLTSFLSFGRNRKVTREQPVEVLASGQDRAPVVAE